MDTRSVRNSRKPQENPVNTPDCLVGDTSCSHDGGALLTARVQAHDVVDQQGGERATTATDKKTPSDKKKKKDTKKEGNFKYIFCFFEKKCYISLKKI